MCYMPRRERRVFRAVSGLRKTSPGIQNSKGFIYVYLSVFVSFLLGSFVVNGLTQTYTEVLRYSQHVGSVHYKLLINYCTMVLDSVNNQQGAILFVSWNVKGINNLVKRSKIFSHLKSLKPDVILLQETHKL